MAINPEEIPPRDYNICPLQGYQVECSGGWDLHHIISRGRASKNKAVQKALDLRYNLIWVCDRHNQQRYADHDTARRALFALNYLRYGEDLRDWIDGLKWKVPPPEYRSEYLLDS